MDHAGVTHVPHRESRAPWIAATIIGLVGAVALWVPSYPPDPWASIISWLVLFGAAVLSAAVAYVLGARGKTVALASLLALVVLTLAWPVIFGVLVVIGLRSSAVSASRARRRSARAHTRRIRASAPDRRRRVTSSDPLGQSPTVGPTEARRSPAHRRQRPASLLCTLRRLRRCSCARRSFNASYSVRNLGSLRSESRKASRSRHRSLSGSVRWRPCAFSDNRSDGLAKWCATPGRCGA